MAEPLLPLGLRLQGRRVVVAGGGTVALRRVGSLLEARADVTVVSPDLVVALEDLAERGLVRWLERPYAAGDLAGAWLALACTSDADVNAQVLAEAEQRHLFCLRADDATTGSAWMPATGRVGPATVSVHGDRDPRRATVLRDVAVAAVEAALREQPAEGFRGVVADGHRGQPADDDRSGPAGAVAGDHRDRDSRSGRVVLVGGGPGDPGLLTLAGWEALAAADVVVVDRLAPLPVLDRLRADVEVVDVSKVPRGRHTPQDVINEVLVERARAGKLVARLKGGDPFVFGRGMEEVQACRAAGVPVRVIPGVTSAIAAPALAGIPVTHRGDSQGFTVVSGHLPPGDERSRVDWSALARTGTTLVVLMGVDTLRAVATALMDAGLGFETPVACVLDAGLPSQRVLCSTLGRIVAEGPPAGLRSPAVTVIGAVAALALETVEPADPGVGEQR